MSNHKKKLLSGIKPTGRPHIGNYFGAMKQFVDLQDEYEAHIMIADFHDLGSQDPEQLREYIYEAYVDHLAIGLDPEKVVFFRQSLVPEHAELTWIFNGLVTVPFLQRAHAYKDAIAKGKEPIMTLFDYPVLMATDILMYDADVVPVGKDQKQHIEIARDIAQKFNNAYGETFTLPEDLILDEVAVIPGTDGQKMSKSYGNTIPLFASDSELKKAIMGIETDSKKPAEPKEADGNTIFELYKLFASKDEQVAMRNGFEEGGLGYGEAKKELLRVVTDFVAPLRERREAIAADRAAVLKIMENGSERARSIAKAKMMSVRDKIGLTVHL